MTSLTDTDPEIALTAAALGIDYAVHDPGLDRFPWQLALTDARVVLLSADLGRSVVLSGGGDIREPHDPHAVPLPAVPAAVLAAVRTALAPADAGAGAA